MKEQKIDMINMEGLGWKKKKVAILLLYSLCFLVSFIMKNVYKSKDRLCFLNFVFSKRKFGWWKLDTYILLQINI